ncbi:Gfo/Idh/MocA family protein [Paenactinomyces guangxiensis]|uniref:Gfo/Idh/MocA family oxidoreductase n=1 Tax=Paenactinomyces guangxiensis TaxID=1490290 RepID=A0A7W1WPB0_9BACL|nr:Gfo/Idh/MocA family oxidoreductase [Paenactinomyces guangxiensis]MBA4493572.1 Gfo/Idh/MocA family oxidoreductase [Paenactinomyces guangxiensis]MBH8590663.1 Gfo/Idh/MocA family oxidoreductase [Paenactinomyces guangxiensis]
MKKYAICGVSNRALTMFIKPLLRQFSHGNKIVAVLDRDPRRFEVCREEYPELVEVPAYLPDQFDQMMKDTRPDAIIIASRDDTHLNYILQGLEKDTEVITEKPMVTSAADAVKVLQAESRSKGKVTVTFNYRYNPYHRKIKEMILQGKLGRITSVDLNWYVDTYHGASYFKRWHRLRRNSGGLSIHKSTHHFDLVNWWLDQKPLEVFAYGDLHYYGPNGEHNPEKEDHRFCGTCHVRENCEYYMRWTARSYQNSIRDDHLRADEMHLSKPGYTDYRPDACIFDSEIDIEDTYAVTVKYDRGTLLSYSINFSAPYEGYRLAINGTKGRIETTEYHEPSRIPFPFPEQTIDYYPLFGSKEIIHVVRNEGGHGGGDPLLLEDIFLGNDPRRNYPILAGAEAGAYSIAIGEAVWRSCKENKPIRIDDLLDINKEKL